MVSYLLPWILLVLTLGSGCGVSATGPAVPQQPNIILIYADDLGKGLLSHEGQEIIQTPHIDQLAAEGLRFRNAHSCMLCAPARAALLSGLHDCHAAGFEITSARIYEQISTGEATREEIEKKINDKLSPIPENQIFLAEIAQKAGYRTAQFGKLDWGFATTHDQLTRHGWDHYFGYMDHVRAHGFYPPFLFSDNELVEIEGNTLVNCGKSLEPETPAAYAERWNREGKDVYSQNLFMDSVLQFIADHRDRPFFLYFPTQLPHGPVAIPEVHADFKDDDRLTEIEKEYASMVKMLDDNVGRIMDQLQKLKLDDHTIVIFTSDNGHEIYYAKEGRITKPYRNMETGELFDDLNGKYYSDAAGDVFNGNNGRAGLKRSNLEGGIEVPLIIRWPQKVSPGSVSDRLVANYDLLATVADITGFAGNIQTDGRSFYNELIGTQPVAEHDFVVYASFRGPTLLTKDGWKLRTYLSKDVFELYYLPDDYREEHDLSAQYPDRLHELKQRLLEACDGDFINGLYAPGNQIRVE
ncbi:sulfatase-like hydrolase/transferase [Flavilitoribacter nigricans]|uniref:Sulfatase n=1 Tax=Flavilitoribacter nigricans (strain ATCC 23147 / DSM 23189 / NBRC 102662 / NCIMB 1420 / SS-2) TaxID=1122177 RepID=A0A2D0N1X9_FLAN2|nr:sulfatase-like hydrolase/transferase [Flavilitoribacter nigricans]PHN02376.1 sulfatase [Flavilitoribacter nigricans DSM 23189 = NBRC 102662]